MSLTSTLTFISCCHQLAVTPPPPPSCFFLPTKLKSDNMARKKPTRVHKPALRILSSEVGDSDLGLTRRHTSGRPMRKRARPAPAEDSPFVDSAIALDDSSSDGANDDELHVMSRNRKRKRSTSPPVVAAADQRPASSDSEQDLVPSSRPAGVDDATRQPGPPMQRPTQISISNLTIVLPPGHVGPITLRIDPTTLPSNPPALLHTPGSRPSLITKLPISIPMRSKGAHEKKKTGFLDLVSRSSTRRMSEANANRSQPAELRNDIYRLTLVTEGRLNFGQPKGFSRSAALLRTCKQVHAEGTSILYSENRFYFCRRTSRYGSFWDDDWRELGYRAVHAFVKTIGPVNLGHLRHLSFQFDDATPCLNPGAMSHEERRFVNDDVLMSILRHLGAHTRLEQLDLNFHGRRRVERSDTRLVEYLRRIRADRVRFFTYPIGLETVGAMESKQDESVRQLLLKSMTRKKKLYPVKDAAPV